MSAETMEWLNTMTLIGYTEKRGHAWHHRAEFQGDEPNHYTGAVPIEDVRRRLFNSVDVQAAPLQYTANSPITYEVDGVELTTDQITDPTRQVIYNAVNGTVFGVFSDTYAIHQYDEWLLKNVANLLDESEDGLGIGSAVLLEGGAVAAVQIEMPETVRGPGEFDFRPYLLAMTSHNGTRATQYNDCVQVMVCDNTLRIAQGQGTAFRVKHTRNSGLRIQDARDALGLIVAKQDEVTAELDELLKIKVSDSDWQKILDGLFPVKDDASDRSRVIATNKMGELNRMYKHDARAAQWKGTGLGVVQAVNTWSQWEASAKGLGDGSKAQARYNRSLMNATDGSLDKQYKQVREMLAAL
jgi:phage/plasmid-like protein (TIGR03299 family)